MILSEFANDPVTAPDQTNEGLPQDQAPSPKKSLKEFGQLIKTKYPFDYQDMDDVDLGKKVLKKYPEYGDMVDLGDLVGDIYSKVSPNLIPMSSFEKQVQESLQPTEGLVQRGVSPFLRETGGIQLPLSAFKDLDPTKANDLEFADTVTRATWGGLSLSEVQELFHQAGLPIADLDFERKVGAAARQHVLYGKDKPDYQIPVGQKYSTVLLRNALSEGGLPAFNAMAKKLLDEDSQVAQSIHQITPEERDKILSTRRSVSLKLGTAQATMAQNEFWTNLLSMGNPMTMGRLRETNLVPGTADAKEQLTRVSPFLPEFYKDQSISDALIEIAPGVITNTTRMLAMAGLGSAVGQATNLGPALGSILGTQADVGLQNLDKPLGEQATHQLINLAMMGGGMTAGVARNVLKARGINIPNVIYVPTEGLAMGLGSLGGMEILTPEATFQQKLANSLVGGLMPIGFHVAAGMSKTRPRIVEEPTPKPAQKLLGSGIGDLRLEETFPIYQGKFADSYTINLTKPGLDPIQLPYQPGEQIPLFDAVIGGQNARSSIAKSLTGLSDGELQQAFLMAGGMETNLPSDRGELVSAILDLHSSKFPLMEATQENKAQLMERWMDITREDKLLETPFHFGKTYQLLEDAPNYYKIRDLDRPTAIFRIGKQSPGGLTANIETVTSTTGRTLERLLTIPDFMGDKAVTQPILFPEPQAKVTTAGEAPTTTTTNRQGAVARLKMLEEFKSSPEFKASSAEAKKSINSEIKSLRKQISTPVEREQLFVTKPQAEQHLENLKSFTQREEFKTLDPQYQEVVKREVSDLEFLLKENTGSPEDVLRQAQLYKAPEGKIPVSIPTNFIEDSVVKTIADLTLGKTPPKVKPEYRIDLFNQSAPADSPLWRAIDKAPTETLADVVKRSGGDPTAMSRVTLELAAFDALGGKRVSKSTTAEPGFIIDARQRLKDYSTGRQLGSGGQIFDQALVYAYDYIYKPGMKFVDFAERMIEKFGEEIGFKLPDLWDRVVNNPKPKDLVEQYSGLENPKVSEILGAVPKSKDPIPVGEAEQIGLAVDAESLLKTPEVLQPKPIDWQKTLYPEDMLRGVDTTPEEIASLADGISTRKRIISKEAYTEAKREIQDSLRTTQSGVSPRQLRAMSVVMAYHVENGIYNFGKAFSEKAIELFGDKAKTNMMDLAEDTFRYLRMYRQSPVLHHLTQLPGGLTLGKVLDSTHKIAFGGVDAFRKAFSLGSRSPQAREIGDIWSEKQAGIARAVDTMKAQLGTLHDWAEGFYYYHKGQGIRRSDLNSKKLRMELNYALDEGNEVALLDKLDVPADVKVAISEMRKVLADTREQVRAIAPNALETVVENYFPRLWKRPGDTSATGPHEALTGSPLTGSKNFMKQRTIDSTRYGVEELGWELASENFVDNFITRYTEMQKFIKMNEVVQYMRKNSMEKVVDRTQLKEISEYWRPLDDSVSTIAEKVEKANGDVSYKDSGKVRVYPAMVADLINSHLAPSLHQYPAFRAWNAFTNFASQFQLIGLFHMALVSADAASRLPAIGVKGLAFDGWQHLYHKEPQKALRVFKESAKAMAKGIIPGYNIGTVVWKGHKMLAEWDRPGTQSPDIQQKVRILQHGGVQARMEGHFQSKAISGIVKNIRNVVELMANEDPEVNKIFGTAKEVASGVAKIPFAATELIMKPMMEQFVPRAKLGVEYYLAGYEIARMGPRANAKEVRRTMARVRDVVDDTLGQLNYGNLHMNKAVKEVTMSIIRATGFQIGSLRTAYAPIPEAARFAKDIVTPGARADFTHRLSYLFGMGIGLTVMHGFIQAALTRYNTGNWDVSAIEPKDIIAFRTGRKDQNGDDERWYIPNYATKEIYPVWSRVAEGRFSKAADVAVEMLGHKLNPGINMMLEAKKNQDFYGRYIVDPNSPESKWTQYGSFALDQLKPFFLRNKEMMEQRGVTDPATKYASFFGPVPAPQYINASTSEDVMMDILKEHYPKSGKSKEEYDRGVARRKFINQWRQAVQTGDELLQQQVEAEISKAVEAGVINAYDQKIIFQGVDKQRTQELFARLTQQSLLDAIRIYESWMSPDERKLVIQTLMKARPRIQRMALSPMAKEELTKRLDTILDRDVNLDSLEQEEESSTSLTPDNQP